MIFEQTRLQELVANPIEGLNVELKRWLNPEEDLGIAKIVRACFAIRNRNGGYVVIGFDDKTLLPDTDHEPSDVRARFHLDKVQGIVSRYASQLFEIGMGFGTRQGREYPIIVIPGGVPAFARRWRLKQT
jgi:hypothetical protein